MTDPSDLRELAHRLEVLREQEPSPLRAALLNAVASHLRSMAADVRTEAERELSAQESVR